jgi:hypothetical protein
LLLLRDSETARRLRHDMMMPRAVVGDWNAECSFSSTAAACTSTSYELQHFVMADETAYGKSSNRNQFDAYKRFMDLQKEQLQRACSHLQKSKVCRIITQIDHPYHCLLPSMLVT